MVPWVGMQFVIVVFFDHTLFFSISVHLHSIYVEECGGSVIECSAQDPGVAGSSLTRGTLLCP